MKLEISVQDSITEKIYNISTLCDSIEYKTFMNGQPGKLTLIMHKDPSNVLQELNIGSIIRFIVDGYRVFLGYIFILATYAKETYKITAYDQLRYLKNNEFYITSNMTASQIFEMICKEWELKYKIRDPSNYICPTFKHENTSLYSVIEYALTQTVVNEKKPYFIRDEFGVLVFTSLEKEKTNLILGEKSLLTDYTYETSIDKDTYNDVKLVRDNEETGLRDVWIAYDSSTQKRWGKLRLLQQADKNANESQISKKALDLLELKNRKTQTLKLTALGVKELKAGNGFRLKLEKLNIEFQDMWVLNITHNYTKDLHTMSLEAFVIN